MAALLNSRRGCVESAELGAKSCYEEQTCTYSISPQAMTAAAAVRRSISETGLQTYGDAMEEQTVEIARALLGFLAQETNNGH